MNETKRRLIYLEHTNFIFRTNFSGDPSRDNFGSDYRKATFIIPTEEQANEMLDMGLNVKQTKPRPGYEDEYEPVFYISANAKYHDDPDERDPRILLISGDTEPRLLDADSVAIIDRIRVKNVDAVLNVYTNQRTGKISLYIRTLYVTQDTEEDPFAAKYYRN